MTSRIPFYLLKDLQSGMFVTRNMGLSNRPLPLCKWTAEKLAVSKYGDQHAKYCALIHHSGPVDYIRKGRVRKVPGPRKKYPAKPRAAGYWKAYRKRRKHNSRCSTCPKFLGFYTSHVQCGACRKKKRLAMKKLRDGRKP